LHVGRAQEDDAIAGEGVLAPPAEEGLEKGTWRRRKKKKVKDGSLKGVPPIPYRKLYR
jgi:hypothetical protein